MAPLWTLKILLVCGVDETCNIYFIWQKNNRQLRASNYAVCQPVMGRRRVLLGEDEPLSYRKKKNDQDVCICTHTHTPSVLGAAVDTWWTPTQHSLPATTHTEQAGPWEQRSHLSAEGQKIVGRLCSQAAATKCPWAKHLSLLTDVCADRQTVPRFGLPVQGATRVTTWAQKKAKNKQLFTLMACEGTFSRI